MFETGIKRGERDREGRKRGREGKEGREERGERRIAIKTVTFMGIERGY